MRNSAKLSSIVAPLDQCCSGARIRRVVGQGHTLSYNPVLHPVRDGRESSSVTRPAEVADDSVTGSVGLENGHVLARLALRLTRGVGVDSVWVPTLKGS